MTAQKTGPDGLINALNGTFGTHPGKRASHAKGFSVTGEFRPVHDTGLKIPMLEGGALPVVARFSVGGGNPNISDKSRTVRGIGVSIGPGKDQLDLVMISAPVFFAATPEQFVAFLEARKPDPDLGGPDPVKVKAFNDSNPNTVPHQVFLRDNPPFRSYGLIAYHSCNAFYIDGVDGPLLARWGLVPANLSELETARLTEQEEASFPDQFLESEMSERLLQGPVEWHLDLQLATEGDAVTDPTAPWSGKGGTIRVGTLFIDTSVGSEQDGRVYDPLTLPDGIRATDDPILNARRAAYSVSHERRKN